MSDYAQGHSTGLLASTEEHNIVHAFLDRFLWEEISDGDQESGMYFLVFRMFLNILKDRNHEYEPSFSIVLSNMVVSMAVAESVVGIYIYKYI